MLNFIVSTFVAVAIMISVLSFVSSLLRMFKTNKDLSYIDHSPYMRNRRSRKN